MKRILRAFVDWLAPDGPITVDWFVRVALPCAGAALVLGVLSKLLGL